MWFFPILHKTLVLPLNSEEVILIIQKMTDFDPSNENQKKRLFRGQLNRNSFKIILDTLPPHNSVPLLTGQVEGTRSGSILFLRLGLLPSSQWYLWVSFVLCFICSAVFIWIAEQYFAAALAILIAWLNYLILLINFKRKANITLDKITELLSES